MAGGGSAGAGEARSPPLASTSCRCRADRVASGSRGLAPPSVAPVVDQPPALIRPLPGPVASPFRYRRATPFLTGQRRVLRLVARSGQRVVAPCAGVVAFAGRTPRSRTVTVRCGGWAVTVSGIGPAAVGRGARVRGGALLGRAAGARIALGVRRTSDPFGYVDPAPLLREPRPILRFAPLGPAPRRPAPAVPRPMLRPAARPATSPIGRPTAAPASRPSPEPAPSRRAPLPAWIGLALAAVGLPGGLAVGSVRRRRRGRPAATRAAVGGRRPRPGGRAIDPPVALIHEWATRSRRRSST